MKAHDQSLIPATAEGVKMQMVSAEVKAVWESDAGHAADGCYQPLISVAAGSDAPVCHRWECGGLSRQLSAFLAFAFLLATQGRSGRDQGPVGIGRLRTHPGRWLKTFADFLGGEKAIYPRNSVIL